MRTFEIGSRGPGGTRYVNLKLDVGSPPKRELEIVSGCGWQRPPPNVNLKLDLGVPGTKKCEVGIRSGGFRGQTNVNLKLDLEIGSRGPGGTRNVNLTFDVGGKGPPKCEPEIVSGVSGIQKM